MKWFCKYYVLKHRFILLQKKYNELLESLEKKGFWEKEDFNV